MKDRIQTRRNFLRTAGLCAGLSGSEGAGQPGEEGDHLAATQRLIVAGESQAALHGGGKAGERSQGVSYEHVRVRGL